jgi:hypothetical protein
MLEGWPNTAVRLADWRRVTQQGVIFVRDGRSKTPMRPKARGLAQHGPPSWLEKSDLAGVILYVMDRPYRLPFPCCTGNELVYIKS